MTDAKRAAAGSDDLLRDFRGSGLMRPLLITVAVHALVILATSLPWLRAALGGGKADLTEEQRLDAAVKEATASLQAIAKEHGIRPQDLGNRFSAGGKPAAKAPAAEKPAGTQKPVPSNTEAAALPAAPIDAPKTDAPAAPPGPALPEVKDDVDLFK